MIRLIMAVLLWLLPVLRVVLGFGLARAGLVLRRVHALVLRVAGGGGWLLRRLPGRAVLHPGHPHPARGRLQPALGVDEDIARRDNPLSVPHSIQHNVAFSHLPPE